MRQRRFQWFLPVTLTAVLFFGCGRKPGDKLYYEGLAEWKAGNHVRARALLEKSIRRRAGSSDNADACNRLGLLLWEMGEVDSAVKAFDESCRIDAEQYGPLCNLGVALSAQNDFTAAERAFREAALLQPNDSRPLIHAGVAYMQNAKWKDARRNLIRALERAPADPQLQNLLALTELNLTGAGAAIKRLQTLVSRNPGYTPALFNIASIQLHELKNPETAKKYFTLYLKTSSGTDKFSALARVRLQELSGPVEKPGLHIPQSKQRNPKEAAKLFQQALALHHGGKLEQAISGYKEALGQDRTYAQAFYNLGLAYYASGQMTLAGEAFAQAVRLNPAFVDARYNAALVDHYHLGKTERALSELSTILTQNPDYQPAIDLLERIKKTGTRE